MASTADGPILSTTTSILLLEPTNLHDGVTAASIGDSIERLIQLRSDAVDVVTVLHDAFWTSNDELVDATGALLPSHQSRAIIDDIDTTLTQVVRQEYPQIPQTLRRLDGPPEIGPRVDDMAFVTPRSPALVRAMESVDVIISGDRGSEKLRTILEGLSLHEQAAFAHYLRGYGYATLIYMGEWDARLYFRMVLEGRPVEIVFHYGHQDAPWPIIY